MKFRRIRMSLKSLNFQYEPLPSSAPPSHQKNIKFKLYNNLLNIILSNLWLKFVQQMDLIFALL